MMIMMIMVVVWIKDLMNLGMVEYAVIWIKDLTNLGMAEYELPPIPNGFIGIPQRLIAPMLAPEDYHLLGDIGKPLTQFTLPSFSPLTPTVPPISPSPVESSNNNFLTPTTLETNCNHPLRRLINKQKNTVKIIPKTKMNWLTLSDRLSKLLSNIDEIVDEQNDKTNTLPIDKMTDILSQIDNDKILLEL